MLWSDPKLKIVAIKTLAQHTTKMTQITTHMLETNDLIICFKKKIISIWRRAMPTVSRAIFQYLPHH